MTGPIKPECKIHTLYTGKAVTISGRCRNGDFSGRGTQPPNLDRGDVPGCACPRIGVNDKGIECRRTISDRMLHKSEYFTSWLI